MIVCLALTLGFAACAAQGSESVEAVPTVASTVDSTVQTSPAVPTTESPVATQPTAVDAVAIAAPQQTQRVIEEPVPAFPILEPGTDITPPDPPADPPVDPPDEDAEIRLEPFPGTLALTFDDGPDPKWTPIILDILAERGIKATFFVIGRKVDLYPEMAQRIVDEGHSLQSHAYYHHDLTTRSDASIGRLIDDAAEAIFNATGEMPVCLRPPGGATNGRVSRIAAEHGHVVVMWSPGGSSGDYAHHSTSGVIRRAADWQAGDVTLMHDIWGWLYRDALDLMLDDLDSRGIGYSTICVPVVVIARYDPGSRGFTKE